MLLRGGLRDFRRSQFHVGAEFLGRCRRSGVEVKVGFGGSAFESLLCESIAGRNDPFGANILQGIDGLAVVEVPGRLGR